MTTKVFHDSETPAHGQQVISACAFIHAEFDGITKVFLPKRAETKKFLPGLYELPGGHIDFGEDLLDGLRRELREELGMEVRIGDPFAAFTYENTVKGSHTVEVIYFAQFVGPLEAVTINPEDHSRFDWFTREEALEQRAGMVPVDQAVHKDGEEDAEYRTLTRGFALLSGAGLDFGRER